MDEYRRLCEMLEGTYAALLAVAGSVFPRGSRVRAPSRAGAARKQPAIVVRHEVCVRGIDVWVRLEGSGRVVSCRYEEVEP